MAAKKWYTVWEGRIPGVYNNWAACEAQTKGYSGARFKGFPTEKEARDAFAGANDIMNKEDVVPVKTKDTISVDAACSGNPGVMEFRGVDTETGKPLFEYGPFPLGTNNIGEFLAVVTALQMCEKENKPTVIYTDSVTAMAWVRDKKVSTNLVRDDQTKELWSLIDEKLGWLHANQYSSVVEKWDTNTLGEIKADFGRK